MATTDPAAPMTRRRFVGAMGAGVLAATGGFANGQRPRVVIDGLGEVRLSYPPALLDEIIASGLRVCVVTVGNPALHGPNAFDDVWAEIDAYDRHIARYPNRLSRVRSVADIERAARDGTIGLIYYPQNATAIQDDLGRLDALHDLGVRIVQLTYNTRNLLGDGCYERTNGGLSQFGVDAVHRMNELGILVDVSHCGPATTMDGITMSSRPVAVTHAGCLAVHQHPRNKSDDALRALADRGGVIGICQINPFLGPRERNTLDDYLAHVEHAINVAGVEHIGIGSDREYRRIPDTREERQKLADELSRLRPVSVDDVAWPFFVTALNHPRRMETIADALGDRGHSADVIDKIMGANFYRLFRETIG